MRFIINSLQLLSILFLVLMTGCKKDDPQREDVPELITKVTLKFTPQGGGAVVTTTATDPDGEGVQNIKVDGAINLNANKTYVLAIDLRNELAINLNSGYDITEEVREEGDEHMFFFSWTNNVFASPQGDGNLDNRSDVVNYTGGSDAVDKNGLPLGLSTTWTTGSTSNSVFRVLLKHQPGLKSASSDSKTGETDLDLSFVLNIQ